MRCASARKDRLALGTRRAGEVVRPKLAHTWQDTDCRLPIGVEQEKGQVVAKLQPAAMPVCVWVDVVLVDTKQGHLQPPEHARSME